MDDSAHGFVSGRSIVTNAMQHVGTKALLKCDIKSFFPSIKIARIVAIFESFGYSSTVSLILAKLCTLGGCLPQGAATSPALSNIVVRRMDMRLRLLSEQCNLKYSRYADDMAFSGDKISVGFYKVVEKIVKQEGFRLNQRKTRLIRGKGRKIIAGVSVGGSSPMLPKNMKRKIRREVHLLLANGIMQQSFHEGVFDFQYIDRVAGRLAFWRSVEPNSAFVIENWPKLREMQIGSLIEMQRQ